MFILRIMFKRLFANITRTLKIQAFKRLPVITNIFSNRIKINQSLSGTANVIVKMNNYDSVERTSGKNSQFMR